MMKRTRSRGGPDDGTTTPVARSFDAQISAWRRSLEAIVRKADDRRSSGSIEASASYRAIASRSSLRLARLCFASMAAMPGIVAEAFRGDRDACRATYTPDVTASVPPLRYLAADEVRAAMPPIDERLRLAELTMTALAEPGVGELPPKIGVHPRQDGSFAHAMPAHLRAGAPTDDLVGMKWIAGFPGNASLGIPAIHGLVVLNDPSTGVPVAVLDAGPITAERTAAVSGVAIARFAPDVAGRAPRAAVVGGGVQGRSHLEVLGHLLPGVEIAVFDRHRERAESLAATAR